MMPVTGRCLRVSASAASRSSNRISFSRHKETNPVAVAERLDRGLMNLASVTRHLGQNIAIRSDGANPLLLAKNSSEVFFTIQHFESEGYIKGKTASPPTEISLTGKGLARVSDLQRGL